MAPSEKAMRTFIKPLAWLPVIIINAIIVWSYFAYMVIFGFGTVKDTAERVIYLSLYNPIFIIFMISYWRTIMCSPGRVPSQFYLSISDKERYDAAENPQAVVDDLAKNLPILTRSVAGGARFCDVCQLIKPDRCHHCSMCNSCVLKMDHHCPWVNNCVGFGNYKFFFLFLLHGIFYTCFVSLTTLKYFLKFWQAGSPKADSSLHVLFLFFIASMFFISLWSLFGYHIYLMLNNRSTLESFRAPVFRSGPDKDGFNLGKISNIRQVFGQKKSLWFLPMYTTIGNGYSFPTAGSLSPESEGLLNGQLSYERNLHVCSERDGLLSNGSDSPTYPDETRGVVVEGLREMGHDSDVDDVESESEINIVDQKQLNNQTTVNLDTDNIVRPLHSL